MPPVLVHTARTPALAEILKDLLVEQGIEAMVIGAANTIGWREADPSDVWIADENDLARATKIVTEFEKPAGEPSGWGWRCPKCGEISEPQFMECWNCGGSADGDPIVVRGGNPTSRHIQREWMQPDHPVREGLERIRRRRRVCVALSIAWFAATVATESEAIFFGMFFVLLIAGIVLHHSRCPSCGERFFRKTVRRFIKVQTWSRCAHCDLRLDGSSIGGGR